MRSVLERVINLLAYLLTSPRPVTIDEIRTTVAGYDQDSDEAFRRMFERDKELLRRLGVPLSMAPTDSWAVEQGYVIPPEAYRMPDPELSDEERAALWLAAQVVRIGGRPSGPEAILKLGGARTTSAVEPFSADLGAEVDVLGDLYGAVTDRRRVSFGYRERRRTVDPHGLGHRRGHWYLVAVEEGQTRVFRIDRMDRVRVGDEPGAFERDPLVNVRKELASQPWEVGEEEPVLVRVRFDPEVAWWAVRRLGDDAADREVEPDGGAVVTLEVSHLDAFIGWVLSFGDQAEVLSPAEVRQAVIDRVRGVA